MCKTECPKTEIRRRVGNRFQYVFDRVDGLESIAKVSELVGDGNKNKRLYLVNHDITEIASVIVSVIAFVLIMITHGNLLAGLDGRRVNDWFSILF